MAHEHPEAMDNFFDIRADTYDEHMRESVEGFSQFYAGVAEVIRPTEDRVRILDLGCGTGLELQGIFQRAPRALVTAVDLSENMLLLLADKYSSRLDQLTLVCASYLEADLGQKEYDYVVSVMTMHHLLYAAKLSLYEKIHRALVEGGRYVEGDYVVSPEDENNYLAAYHKMAASLEAVGDGTHHIDIPFSLDTQMRLLLQAGFRDVQMVWQLDEATVLMADA